MNVHDWLANLPYADPESSCRIVEITFNNGSRKDYFKNTSLNYFEKGQMVAVEGVNGFDVGMVNLTGELRLSARPFFGGGGKAGAVPIPFSRRRLAML